MKYLQPKNKNSLPVLIASTVLIAATLISCGGAKDEAADAGLPADSGLPVFNLKGFALCGKQGDTLTFKTKTHVAFGLESDNRFVYLFNQTEPLLLSAEKFGNDPIPSKYKLGYCKPVTADNNDAAVFSAALTALKSHLDGSSTLTPAQLQLQNERLKQTMHAVTDSKETLILAFSVITAYEKMRGGAFFANAATKGGFPNEYYGATSTDIDRAVLTIQQSIHDGAFEASTFAKYKDVLAGKKFNSSDWFPGKVKIPANPNTIYSARINATMVKDVDTRSAFSSVGAIARRPTGYYLAAGDVAKVTVPQSMVNAKFVIQVGANLHDKYIKSTIARPFRVTTKFPIVSTVTEIANPNGGGIYIDVPYLANAGSDVTITIQNAVPAPFFSATALNKVTLQQWQDVQRNNPAPWADFMSDKFMMTLPTKWIDKYADPLTLIKDWDDRMDVVSDLLGRNRVRNNQILYLIVDTSLLSDAFGIGYPSGNNGYNPGDPADGNSKNWYLRPDKDFSEIEFHELGHAELFSNFPGEGEAANNILTVAVSNKLYGVDIDKGLSKSMNNTSQLIGREQAALNWMVTPNFRAGKAMDITGSEKNEVRYQQRGYAKYAEIAALFGWDKLGKFHLEENRVFRNEVVAAGAGLSQVDSRILRMSIAAGVDLTPLIHFWGVQPVDVAKLSTAMNAAGLKPSLDIYNRLKVYQGMIPMDNAAFKAHAVKFLNKPVDAISGANKSADYGEGWYAAWLNTYGAAEGQAAQTAFDNIFTKYFPGGKPAQ
jgi:Peptidase M60, enhancin and enhancin-like/N-terminal domain of M60-like peptidases